MARVLVVADLHLDQWKHAGLDPLDRLSRDEWAGLDGVIVAGDLANDPLRKWPRHLSALARRIAPARIHVVPGNHDYYGLGIDGDAVLARLCAEQGVGFAQMAAIAIAGRPFLCTTLWTAPGRRDAMLAHDLRRIPGPGGRALRPADLAACHRRQAEWLASGLAGAGGRAVVVTHHVPEPRLLAPGAAGAGGHAARMGALIARHPPRAWLFGHAHDAPGGRIAGVACVNVALGPPPAPGPEGGAEAVLAAAGARLRALIRSF